MMCPCYSGLPYERCCKPLHDGQPAPTAVALMRSRYSGYALKKVDYIIETTHPDLAPHIKEKKELLQFCKETSFDGLDILNFDEENVKFRAHLSQNGKDCSFNEKSHFKKVDGKWKYHSGDIE